MKQIVLIHGAIGGADQLEPLKKFLEDDFKIHLFEFEGHGKKAEYVAPFTLENFDRQFTEEVTRIGDKVHIFGYSMGGFVSLLHASKRQENVASLITLGTKMKWSSEIARQEVKHLNPAIIKEKVPKFAQALEKRHGELWGQVLEKTADLMLELGDLQPIKKEVMQTVSIPVLLCLADHDNMVSREETEEVCDWIPNAQFLSIEASKHPIEQVNLTALANAIRSFVHSID